MPCSGAEARVGNLSVRSRRSAAASRPILAMGKIHGGIIRPHPSSQGQAEGRARDWQRIGRAEAPDLGKADEAEKQTTNADGGFVIIEWPGTFP
jgi:hypothetical protein